MTKTLEFPASELVEKIQSGEIPPATYIHVTLDVPDTQQTSEEIARRVASLHRFFTESAVAGVVVDDSREGISGQDVERE